jgi:quinol monooxygenase YgiN
MSAPVSVIARFFPKEGHESAVEAILKGMVNPTRSEPGCQRYDLYRVKDGPTQFALFEIYKDQPALEAHRATEHYKNYRARIVDLLSEPINVLVLNGVDVKQA